MLMHTTLLIFKMDPVKYIFEKSTLIGRVNHWQMALTKYDIQHVTQKAIKGSVLSGLPYTSTFGGLSVHALRIP